MLEELISIKKNFLFKCLISAVTPLQIVFLIIMDACLFGSGSMLYAVMHIVLLIPVVLQNEISVKKKYFIKVWDFF